MSPNIVPLAFCPPIMLDASQSPYSLRGDKRQSFPSWQHSDQKTCKGLNATQNSVLAKTKTIFQLKIVFMFSLFSHTEKLQLKLTLLWYKIGRVVKWAHLKHWLLTLLFLSALRLQCYRIMPQETIPRVMMVTIAGFCGEVAQYRNPGYLLHRNAPSNLCFSLSLLNDNPMTTQTPFGKYLRFTPLPSKITKSST